MFYSAQKLTRIFARPGAEPTSPEHLLAQAEKSGWPKPRKGRGGLGWDSPDVPLIGESMGFLRRPSKAMVWTVFVTKGGVLKTTLTLNLARLAALHNHRTLVIGLDLQGDISTSLGFEPTIQSESLDEALAAVDATRGLYDHFEGRVGLDDLILPTDLPTLDFIPETPELVALEQRLMSRNRREYWLKERVIEPLRQRYDLILIDCSPNWNLLITNALAAADTLLSPVECKVNNYRNLKMFRSFMAQFQSDLGLKLQHLFVPTRLSPNRRLSREIAEWYQANLPDCSPTAIRESVQGEEASAVHLSIPEYAPDSAAAEEIKQVLSFVWPLALSQRIQSRPFGDRSTLKEVDHGPESV